MCAVSRRWTCNQGATRWIARSGGLRYNDVMDLPSASGLGLPVWETVPVMATVSRPATAVALIVIGLMVAALLELSWQWRAAHRRHQMVRIFNEAKGSYARGQAGLKTMAEVVTRMPANTRNLSRQGVGLLDAYADSSISFKHLMHNLRTMSRDRALRHLTREYRRLRDYETKFEDFQKHVLCMVSNQAASGTMSPPVPIRRYRAAFAILRHDLQRDLWPVMNEVLAAGVQLKMQDAAGRWRMVPVTFSNGSQAVFSRKWLERAVALRLIIRQPGPSQKVFEFTVEHEHPVRSGMFPIPDFLSHQGGKTAGEKPEEMASSTARVPARPQVSAF